MVVSFAIATSITHLSEKYSPILMRCIPATLMLSHDIRRDRCLLFICKENNVIVRIEGSKVKRIFTDEASLSGVYRKIRLALEKKIRKKVIHPGIKVYYTNIASFLSKTFTSIIFPDTKGKDILELSSVENALYVLSLDRKTLKDFLADINIEKIPLVFPKSIYNLSPDKIIAIVNICLDRIAGGLPPY